MIIATKNIQDIDADVVLVRDNDVFAGKLRPDIAQGNDVESLIQQNIWQISKLTKSEGMGGLYMQNFTLTETHHLAISFLKLIIICFY